VQDAIAKGGKVLTGGEVPDGPGFFYPPTVLASVPREARIFSEEVFGPVAPITTFETEEEAVAQANDSEFGLVAYVFTENVHRSVRVTEGIRAGMIGLNKGLVSNPAAPFGGVKASGFGREGGFEGIDEYLEVKYVAVDV
jgi:succinate-semialdehyde dehydrogenase/glutarate-semialdehyde dehydrogenase